MDPFKLEGICPICGVWITLLLDVDGKPLRTSIPDNYLVGSCQDAFSEEAWLKDEEQEGV